MLVRVREPSATGVAEGLGRMSARRKIFHKGFAPASPVFTLGVIAIVGCSFLPLISTVRAEGSSKSNVSNAKRQAAADYGHRTNAGEVCAGRAQAHIGE